MISIKTDVYQTEDGKLFLDEGEAKLHEQQFIVTELKKYIFEVDEKSTRSSLSTIATFITVHSREIYKILKRFHGQEDL